MPTACRPALRQTVRARWCSEVVLLSPNAITNCSPTRVLRRMSWGRAGGIRVVVGSEMRKGSAFGRVPFRVPREGLPRIRWSQRAQPVGRACRDRRTTNAGFGTSCWSVAISISAWLRRDRSRLQCRRDEHPLPFMRPICARCRRGGCWRGRFGASATAIVVAAAPNRGRGCCGVRGRSPRRARDSAESRARVAPRHRPIPTRARRRSGRRCTTPPPSRPCPTSRLRCGR